MLRLAIAVAVRWQLTNTKGQTFSYIVTHNVFNQPRHQLAPAVSLVAVPLTVLLEGTRLPAQLGIGELPNFQSSQSIDVALDGVVFASGQFVGPNTGHEFESYRADTTVPPHIAAKVLAMQSAGEPIANVIESVTATERSKDLDLSVAGREARQLLQNYRRKGEAFLYQIARGESQQVIDVHR